MASEKHSVIMAMQAVRGVGKEVYSSYVTLNMRAQAVYTLLAVLFVFTKDYIDTYIDQSFVTTALFCLLAASLIFWIIRFISAILYKKFTERCDSHREACKEAYDTIVDRIQKG